jgi:hypothetical protein
VCPDHQPAAGHPRQRRPDRAGGAQCAARRADRGRPRGHRRWRAHPHRPRPGADQSADRRFRPTVPHHRPHDMAAVGPAAQEGALPVLADRSRPRPPGPGDRPAAPGTPPGRPGGLADAAPGEPDAGGGRGTGTPGESFPGERVRAHRGGVRRARPALLPGPADDGRDPGRQLHGLPRPGRGRALRPGRRRRGLGRRPFPAREPGAEAVRLRVADRLRRLPAHARRRRPRDPRDGRLQRRDDRAHRPLPATTPPRCSTPPPAPRPGATGPSSSATRPTSSTSASAPTCR